MISRRRWGNLVAALGLLLAAGPVGADDPIILTRPEQDATYRATVVVRKGVALGTGVLIASVDGEALVLTASHVVEGVGPLAVEVGRYNLGWEHTQSARGFPRRIAATVAAQDRASDLAILRVGGQLRFPYVARVGASLAPIEVGTTVESIGFDRGERLVGFWTKVRRVELFDLEHGGGPRPFLVTNHPPQAGRSGGGLFLEDGTLVGTCLARAEVQPGRVLGMYSNVGNIRRLLGSSASLEALVARSHPVVRLRPTAAVPPPTRSPTPSTGSPISRRTETAPAAK